MQYESGSGGEGLHAGGNGLIREFEFLSDATFTILSERRKHVLLGESKVVHAGKVGDELLKWKTVTSKSAM